MAGTDLSKYPRVGDAVMVWPALRTVRDSARQPVLDDEGAIQKAPARVRDHEGRVITRPIPVVVNAYYYKLLTQGNLDWCSKEEHQKKLLDRKADQPEAPVQNKRASRASRANSENPAGVDETPVSE